MCTFHNPPDYLQLYEGILEKKESIFFEKCSLLKSQICCLSRVTHKYFMCEDFDSTTNPCPLPDASYCDFKQEHTEKLKILREYHNVRDKLEYVLAKTKDPPIDKKYEDLELLGLTLPEQRCVLMDRLKELRLSKQMARKIVKKLIHELEDYQKKGHEKTISEVTVTDLYKSKLIPSQITEEDINNEIGLLKSTFLKKYEKLYLYKVKYEKLDSVMRLELQPKLTKLETAIFLRTHKLEMTKKETAELIKQENLNDKINAEYEKKIKVLTKEFAKVANESAIVSRDIEQLKKSIVEVLKATYHEKKAFLGEIVEIQNDSGVVERIMKLFKQNGSLNLCYTVNHFACELHCSDKRIATLRTLVCGMIQRISIASKLINALEKDLIVLRNDHTKYVYGRDYLGNTIYAAKNNLNKCHQNDVNVARLHLSQDV